ncbi:MAG: prephenate dehydrogenase [Planctomycetota bacterium]|nr:prephenate dehydrogenase [Planctomycetota bacterium]
MVHRLCIVGLGLMGGAVGLTARRRGAATRIVGVGDRSETIEQARRMGAVDDATVDLREGVRDADLVVLAVPVRLIPDAARSVLAACRPQTIVTDLGSSKAGVVAAVEALIAQTKAQAFFVGSHPIAGSEKSGIESAGEVRLEGAACVLTPTPATDNESYRTVDEFWKALGMKTHRLSPEDHDAMLARSSHLPHLLSYALIHAQSGRSLQLAGPGLRDMTRLSGSDVRLWVDIMQQNAGELARVMKEFAAEMQHLAQEVEMLAMAGTPGAESARERLFRYLADAKQRHDEQFAAAPAPSEEPKDENLRSKDTQVVPPPPGG